MPVDLSSRPTPHGFWMAMGSVVLPQYTFVRDGDTLRQVETSPRKQLDRYGRECAETDWQWFACECHMEGLTQ